MLARAWRFLASIIVVPTYWLLQRLVHSAAASKIRLVEDDLRIEKHKNLMLQSLLDVEKAQNQLLAQNHGKWMAMQKAETDAQTARSIVAAEQPSRE